MKKVVILLFMIFIITGCEDKTSNSYSNQISKHTEEVMLEKSNIPVEDTEEEEAITKKEEVIVMTPAIKEETDKIDDNDENYKIHNGRIDCINTTECLKKAKEIEQELISSIQDIDYLAVKTMNNQILGYYINYIFKEYNYPDYETCVSKGEYLKKKLPDRFISYDCDGSTLIIMPEGEND